MMRFAAVTCATLALGFMVSTATAADPPGKAVKAQMVKGTIKLVDASKNLLIVNQKLKKDTVQRELSILDTTAFSITIDGKTTEYVGKEALQVLSGAEGSSVSVKCDKDVNVLKVTVKVKKK